MNSDTFTEQLALLKERRHQHNINFERFKKEFEDLQLGLTRFHFELKKSANEFSEITGQKSNNTFNMDKRPTMLMRAS